MPILSRALRTWRTRVVSLERRVFSEVKFDQHNEKVGQVWRREPKLGSARKCERFAEFELPRMNEIAVVVEGLSMSGRKKRKRKRSSRLDCRLRPRRSLLALNHSPFRAGRNCLFVDVGVVVDRRQQLSSSTRRHRTDSRPDSWQSPNCGQEWLESRRSCCSDLEWLVAWELRSDFCGALT